ncbi:MAG: hypothetical protein KAG28_00185 [Cocleimonas sp.]|nr:hypothetical protein [Cocleimonas sp.]
MNNKSSYQFNRPSLIVSGFVLAGSLAIPLSSVADTSASIDAIMEQLKSQKPRTSIPIPSTTVVEEERKPVLVSKPVEVVEPPVVIEKKERVEIPVTTVKKTVVETIETRVISVEEDKPSVSRVVVDTPPTVAPTKKSVKTSRKRRNKKITKRSSRRITKKIRKQNKKEIKGFSADYRAAIHALLNDQKSPKKVRNKTKLKKKIQRYKATPLKTAKGKPSGWIFLGHYFDELGWLGEYTVKTGNQLPQIGKTYQIKSIFLNLRKTRPLNRKLGKQIRVLHAGDRVKILAVRHIGKNNYWAQIERR